jgi:nucleoside-diphosphate-sugar epimerase
MASTSRVVSAFIAVAAALLLGNRLMRVPSMPAAHSEAYLDRLQQLRESTSTIDASLQKHTFLVIGGTGFTGGAIVRDLKGRGVDSVKVISRRTPALQLPGVKYHKGSIVDYDSIREAVRGVSVVYHTAASYGTPAFGAMGHGNQTWDINLGGMKNVMKACKEEGVSMLIFTSTVDTVFDGTTHYNRTEEASYGTGYAGKYPLSHYAASKIATERHLLGQSSDTLRTLALRPNGIYGPGENWYIPKAVLPGFLLGYVPFYFDLDQRTDFSFVYNLVYAHVAAVHAMETDRTLGGRAFFITDDEEINAAAWGIFTPMIEAAGGEVVPLLRIPPSFLVTISHAMEHFCHQLHELTGGAINIHPPLTTQEAFKAITTHTHSNKAAREVLGYRPLVTTKEGLKWTAEEFKRRYEGQPR